MYNLKYYTSVCLSNVNTAKSLYKSYNISLETNIKRQKDKTFLTSKY